MMTLERVMEVLEELKSVGDVSVKTYSDGVVDVTFEDFEGFDDDWSEIMRDYEMPELVSELEEFFEETLEGDFYLRGEIEGTRFCVGYSSYDI